MRPEWCIVAVDGGYLVAWRDGAGAYAEFRDDEPMRLWYRMYREDRVRRGWRLALLRRLHPVDTQSMPALTTKREAAGV